MVYTIHTHEYMKKKLCRKTEKQTISKVQIYWVYKKMMQRRKTDNFNKNVFWPAPKETAVFPSGPLPPPPAVLQKWFALFLVLAGSRSRPAGWRTMVQGKCETKMKIAPIKSKRTTPGCACLGDCCLWWRRGALLFGLHLPDFCWKSH